MAVLSASCGGGGGTGPLPPAPPPPTIASVVVNPTSANVLPSQTQQFTATVQGTGAFSPSVSWSVNNVAGGSQAFGVISVSGLYAAPSNPPNPNTVTIRATSVADGSKSASASVVVGTAPFQITGVTVSPASISLLSAQTHQFTATVQGTGPFDPSVRWFVNGNLGGDSLRGTVSTSGSYVAPQLVSISTVTVEAVSTVDGALKGSATVNLSQGPPTIDQIVPSAAVAGDQILIQGNSFSGTTTVFFPGPNGLTLDVPLGNTLGSPTQLSVRVPVGTISGPIYVQTVLMSGATLTSNTVAFTRIPFLRIRSDRHDLSPSETTQFHARILGEDLGQAITWSADLGAITPTGVYTAPAVISDTFAVVNGCIENSQVCQQLRLGIHPFRIEPDTPIVSGGNSISLTGIQGAATVAPTWSLVGPGSLSPSGTYAASSALADGGKAAVTAMHGGTSQQTDISVSGAFPGIVNRIADYIDLNQTPFPLGTIAKHVAVSGTRAYVLAASSETGPLNQSEFWIDVYDLTDPLRPVWLDATESLTDGVLLTCGQFLYIMATPDFTINQSVLAGFDISGTRPTPILWRRGMDAATFLNAGCRAVTAPANPIPAGSSAMVDIADLGSGAPVHMPLVLPPPQPPVAWQIVGAASRGNQLFAFVETTDAGGTQSFLVTYDVGSMSPAVLGTLPTSLGVSPRLAGNYLIALPRLRTGFDDSDVYDVSGATPIFVGRLPVGRFLDGGSERAVFADTQTGLRILDVSGTGSPVPVSSVLVEISVQQDAAVFGTYVLSAERAGGWAVYDLSQRGGPVRQQLMNVHSLSGAAREQLVAGHNLYIAAGLPNRGSLLVYDLQTKPATFAGSFDTGNAPSQALAILGNTLFLGTVDNVHVLDVTNPGNPVQIGLIPVGTAALAVAGNSLFVGTVTNQLSVFDVSNPAAPSPLGSVALPDLPIQMVPNGTTLLVANSSAGLLIFDISNPASPALLSQTQPSTNVFGVVVDGNLALLAAWEEGLVIVDCSNVALPVVRAQTRLDTINPYASLSLLANRAATITLQDQIAFIGVFNADPSFPPNNGNAMIYGFDYRQADHPRLVTLAAAGIISSGIRTIISSGSSIFGGGAIFLTEWDSTQPRNTINLFLLPDSLRPPIRLQSAVPVDSAEATSTRLSSGEKTSPLRFIRNGLN